jgi:1-acyl-sn-glycerol-3-phosphate acyltransferase
MSFGLWLLRDVLLQYIGWPLLVKPHVEGLENIPPEGGVILMMNHTVTIDGVVVAGVVKKRNVFPMIKAENFKHPLFGPLVRMWGAYPVERDKMDRQALKHTLELLAAGEVVLIAPEGTRQPALAHPKDGLTYIAIKSGAVIVPAAVYNLESWYDDLLRPRRTHCQVRFGKPFILADITRPEMPAATREMMYQLAMLLPDAYRGEFSDLTCATTQHLVFV